MSRTIILGSNGINFVVAIFLLWLSCFETSIAIRQPLTNGPSTSVCPPGVAVSVESPLAKGKSINQFNLREVSLAIFSDLKIPCDGYLIQWNFIQYMTTIKGLHLGVFRESFDKRTLRLVSDTYINDKRFDRLWAAYRPHIPIQVQAGDFLGLFYDFATLMTGQGVVASTAISNHSRYQNALVVMLSAQELANNNNTVRKNVAAFIPRAVALSAIVQTGQRRTALATPMQAVQRSKLQRRIVRISNDYPNVAGTLTLQVGVNPTISNWRCSGLPKTGRRCRSWLKRFYFDAPSGRCLQFLLCSSTFRLSEQAFETKSECVQTCVPFETLNSESPKPLPTLPLLGIGQSTTTSRPLWESLAPRYYTLPMPFLTAKNPRVQPVPLTQSKSTKIHYITMPPTTTAPKRIQLDYHHERPRYSLSDDERYPIDNNKAINLVPYNTVETHSILHEILELLRPPKLNMLKMYRRRPYRIRTTTPRIPLWTEMVTMRQKTGHFVPLEYDDDYLYDFIPNDDYYHSQPMQQKAPKHDLSNIIVQQHLRGISYFPSGKK